MDLRKFGVIFMTNEELVINGEIYDYRDAIYINENDASDVLVHWSGQRRHGRDYVVADADREVHVFWRRKRTHCYSYRGVVINDSIRKVVNGNKEDGIPANYIFKLRTRNLTIPYNFQAATQEVAVHALGFSIRFNCNGIYEMHVL